MLTKAVLRILNKRVLSKFLIKLSDSVGKKARELNSVGKCKRRDFIATIAPDKSQNENILRAWFKTRP